MAMVLVVLMLMAALVVDLGLQRVARADMQALADIVALDLAREIDGRSATELEPVMRVAAAESVARNADVVGDEVPDLEPVLGRMQPGASGDDFVPVGGAAVPTAVRVVAETSVSFAFSGVTGVADGDADRAAISSAESGACFRLGSFAAALRTGDSAIGEVFEALMGDSDALGVNLRGVGYQGLLTSYVDLQVLAAELGAGSVEALVDQGNISIARLVAASARAVDSEGLTAAQVAAAGGVLATIAARISGAVHGDLGDILSIGRGSAATSKINAVDLLGSAGLAAALAASVADHNNFLHTGVVWNEPHTSHGDIELTVIEPPRQACGAPGSGATASTGQLKLSADIGFNLPNKLLGLEVRSLTADATQTHAHVAATIAGAQGSLTGISCEAGYEEFRTRVDSRLTDVGVTLPFRLRGSIGVAGIVPARLLPAGVAPRLLSLDLELSLTAATRLTTVPHNATDDTVYGVPPHDYSQPEPSAGAGDLVALEPPVVTLSTGTQRATLVAAGLRIPLEVGALDLSGILSAATGSVIGTSLAGVVENLNGALVPLAHLLGLRVAGADVYGVPRPACGLPRLVG